MSLPIDIPVWSGAEVDAEAGPDVTTIPDAEEESLGAALAFQDRSLAASELSALAIEDEDGGWSAYRPPPASVPETSATSPPASLPASPPAATATPPAAPVVAPPAPPPMPGA